MQFAAVKFKLMSTVSALAQSTSLHTEAACRSASQAKVSLRFQTSLVATLKLPSFTG